MYTDCKARAMTGVTLSLREGDTKLVSQFATSKACQNEVCSYSGSSPSRRQPSLPGAGQDHDVTQH